MSGAKSKLTRNPVSANDLVSAVRFCFFLQAKTAASVFSIFADAWSECRIRLEECVYRGVDLSLVVLSPMIETMQGGDPADIRSKTKNFRHRLHAGVVKLRLTFQRITAEGAQRKNVPPHVASRWERVFGIGVGGIGRCLRYKLSEELGHCVYASNPSLKANGWFQKSLARFAWR